MKCGSGITPVAVKRNAVGHEESHNGAFASASYIRQLLQEGKTHLAAEYVPAESSAEFSLARMADDRLLGYALQTRVLAMGTDGLCDIAEARGCEYALYNAVLKMSRSGVASFEGVARELCAKHLTDSKIRRMLLFALMGVTVSDMKSEPHYTRVVASNEVGHSLLRLAKKNAAEGFALISGGSLLSGASDTAKRQFAKNGLAEAIIAPSLTKLK